MKPWKVRFFAAGCILLLAGAWFYLNGRKYNIDGYIVEVVEPTCTESGYSLYTDRETGQVSVKDYVEPLGHDFGEWTILRQPTLLKSGRKEHICNVCAYCEEKDMFCNDGIVHMNLCGNLESISVDNNVCLSVSIDGETPFESYALLKYKGHGTLNHPKKNYTLIFCANDAGEERVELQFKDWNKDSKYCLRAHYNDPTDVRGLTAGELWAQVVSTRENLPDELQRLTAFGAVSGFSVAVYINDEFQGIFSLQTFKDEHLYEIENGEYQAAAITNNNTCEEAYFKGTSDFIKYVNAWEIEECGTEDVTWAQNSLNELLAFVANNSQESFNAKASEYVDIDAAIDYLLFMYSLGISQNMTDNLVLLTYDGHIWMPTAYNMGDAFGLSTDGQGTNPPAFFLPEKTDGIWDSKTGSLLWDRLLNGFEERIKERYTILRKEIFTTENAMAVLNKYWSCIPEEYHLAENNIYPDRPSYTGHELEEMENFYSERLSLLDSIFLRGET